MGRVSPGEILLKYGRWIGATDFAELIAQKNEITERRAKGLMKDALQKKEIRRHIFSDRSVIYGLTEFGPPTNWSYSVVECTADSGGAASVCAERSGVPVHNESQKIHGYPVMSYKITQRIYDEDNNRYFPPNFQRPFPSVGFNILNLNDYPVRVRVRVRMILGGSDKGLVPDSKGYYNDETEMPFGPKPDGLINGNFSVPKECEQSDEELTLQVSVLVIDPDGVEHRLLPKSWTYKRKENSWFYEPKVFVEEQWSNSRLG